MKTTKLKKKTGSVRLWWIIISAYILLKCLINPQPVVSIGNSGLRLGLFNFSNDISDPINNDILTIQPLWKVSAYKTHLGKDSTLPPLKWDSLGNFHLMGTDHLGRDVFAGFICGLEIAVLIGLFVAVFTCLVSLILGVIGAYFERFPLHISRPEQVLWIIFAFISPLMLGWSILGAMTFIGWIWYLILFVGLVLIFRKVFRTKNRILPIDTFNRRFQEFFQPLPDLVILLVVLAIFDKISFVGLILILIILRLPAGAWFLQGRAQQIVYLPHIDQVSTMGVSGWRIMGLHIMPLLKSYSVVFMSLTAARAILSESALSFLGIGPTGEWMSWGSMIRLGLNNMNMWWVALFPIIGLVGLSLLFRFWYKD